MGSALSSPHKGLLSIMVQKIQLLCQTWWHVPLILAVGRLRQENKLKASLNYVITFKLTWAT